MQSSRKICLTIVTGGLLSVGLSAAFAATNASPTASPQGAPQKDPPQWSTHDTTPQARFQTAKKEAGAALQEAQNSCRDLRGAERTGCMKDAQTTYTQDMADAKKLLTP